MDHQINELLYYIQNANDKLHKNDIISTCEDFYTEDEVNSARLMIWNKYKCKGEEDRLPRRTGTSKIKTCLADIYD